jgi:hypothetical protein
MKGLNPLIQKVKVRRMRIRLFYQIKVEHKKDIQSLPPQKNQKTKIPR